MQKRALEKQWDVMLKQENKFLIKSEQKKQTKLDSLVSEKVPEKLISTLNSAFAMSFNVVFEKGVGIIEKSYNKQEIEHGFKVNRYSFSLKQDKKRLKVFESLANKSETKNIVISGVKGVGLGVFGIGLPDIPIFIGMVLKGIYETSLYYGFDYDSETERYFVLSLIEASLSYGDAATQRNNAINDFISSPTLPQNYNQKTKIDGVADVLSTELLVMKFIQGLPIVGVIGGFSDALFVKKILDYSKLKYKRRFLQKYISY